jgi:hypothetical protein
MKRAWVALASLSIAATALAQSPWEGGDLGVPGAARAVDVMVPMCRGLPGDALRDTLIAELRADPLPAVRGTASYGRGNCGYSVIRPADGTTPSGATTAWSRASDALLLAVTRHPEAPIVRVAESQRAQQQRRWRLAAQGRTIAVDPIEVETSLWFAIDAHDGLYAIVERSIEHGLAYGASACPPTIGQPCDPVGPVEAVRFEVHDTTRVRVEPGRPPRIVQHRLRPVGPLHGGG